MVELIAKIISQCITIYFFATPHNIPIIDKDINIYKKVKTALIEAIIGN